MAATKRKPVPVATKCVSPPRKQARYFVGVSDENYTDEEREFMTALDRYKVVNHRPFPTCREVLEVLKALGYRKA